MAERGFIATQDITITTRGCRKTGVKFIIHHFCPTHWNVIRQICVSTKCPCFSGRTAVVSKCTTCPVPWTPESVLPCTKHFNFFSFATKDNAFSNSSCTLRTSSCRCQPQYCFPLYSIPKGYLHWEILLKRFQIWPHFARRKNTNNSSLLVFLS